VQEGQQVFHLGVGNIVRGHCPDASPNRCGDLLVGVGGKIGDDPRSSFTSGSITAVTDCTAALERLGPGRHFRLLCRGVSYVENEAEQEILH
jgi:hypothetical protein